MVHEYNKYIAGVDRFDQAITYYGDLHRFNKLWKNCFVCILEIAIHNSLHSFQRGK